MRDVEDVVQESLLRVWRARTGQTILSPRAFLFRVARNIALDILRRGHRSPVEPAEHLSCLPAIDEAGTGAEQLGQDEKLALLAKAISRLSPRSRELIVLCQIRGLTHREAALQLGISPKTADEHILRGLRRLGKELRLLGYNDSAGL